MKNRIVTIIFLTIIWVGFSYNISLINITLGLALSTFINLWMGKHIHQTRFNPLNFMLLFPHIIYELIISSIQVSNQILSAKIQDSSEIIDIPLECKHETQISLLANLISLTPGTLTVDLSPDMKMLKVHLMLGSNRDDIYDYIKHNLEPKVMRVIRNE